MTVMLRGASSPSVTRRCNMRWLQQIIGAYAVCAVVLSMLSMPDRVALGEADTDVHMDSDCRRGLRRSGRRIPLTGPAAGSGASVRRGSDAPRATRRLWRYRRRVARLGWLLGPSA